MSADVIDRIMIRIRGAETTSPIAVFRWYEDPSRLNAVFSNTIVTQRMIQSGNPSFIGVYDKTVDPKKVERELFRHVDIRSYVCR